MDVWTLDTRTLRASYDQVAADYAAKFFDELDRKPADRALLDAFAAACPRTGRVLDVGCGPGHVGRHLASHGLVVTGIDLSPAMVAVAQKLNPAIEFATADMRALPWDDASIAGIVAFYSVIHIPRPEVPKVLAEFRRVLAPEGRLLLAVHGGTGTIHQDEFLGHCVPFEATYFSLNEIASLVEQAGLHVDDAHQRAPYDFEHQTPRLYVVAHATGVNTIAALGGEVAGPPA
jgi:SAM-dependent methyltransferase